MKRPQAAGLEMVGVGITIVLASLLGYLGGTWLDGRWHTAPAFGAVGLLLGAAGGFVQLFRTVARAGRSDEDGDGQ